MVLIIIGIPVGIVMIVGYINTKIQPDNKYMRTSSNREKYVHKRIIVKVSALGVHVAMKVLIIAIYDAEYK
jgi:hypothetical protein